VIVDFQSFACQNGDWFSTTCSSAANTNFHVTDGITAKVYDYTGNVIGPALASSTIDPAIPFRPQPTRRIAP
jgi:hypothetical protein